MEDIRPRDQSEGLDKRTDPLTETLRLFTHDIHAAMSDVIGGLRLIDAERLDADTRAQVERVQAAGETLAELVDAALMAAAGETLIRLDDDGVDLRGYLTGVAMRWVGRAQEAGLRFEVDRGEGLPDRIGVPRMALDRILSNLISNALKFADIGTVTLRGSLLSDDRLLFSVTDQGPGFTDAALDRLFSPQGRPTNSDDPGPGLGLHIAKDLADGIGGSLTVDKTRANGASVTLSLPRVVWQTGGAPLALPDLSGLRILVAEDNETNQIIVRQVLGKMGAAPRIAADGVEALEILARERFDIALVDIEMPRMSGIELMQAVREFGDGRAKLPLVALTAYVLRDNREAIYAAGADGIIGKPIRSAGAFGRAILRHLGRDVAAGALHHPAEEDGFDQEQFDALLTAAGPDGARELLERLTEDLQSVAGALAAAVPDEDLREIRGQTHILVSLAGAVGADRLRHLAEALNLAAQRQRLPDLPGLFQAVDADLTDLLKAIAARQGGGSR